MISLSVIPAHYPTFNIDGDQAIERPHVDEHAGRIEDRIAI